MSIFPGITVQDFAVAIHIDIPEIEGLLCRESPRVESLTQLQELQGFNSGIQNRA
jgi:hypothetical protein